MEQQTWQPLHEGGAQPDASLGIKGEGDMVGLKVSGNQCFVCELRKPFMSPSERVSYLRSLYQVVSFTVKSTTDISMVGARRAWTSCVTLKSTGDELVCP